MKKLLFIITIFLIAHTSHAQQTFTSSDPAYIEGVKAGEAALNAEKYDSCLIYYSGAFEIKKTSVLSTLRAAACAFSADKSDVLNAYLDRAFELNWDQSKGIFENYDEFRYLDGSAFSKDIEARWNTAAKKSGLDLALMEEFSQIQITDQEQRQLMRKMSDQYGWQSPQMDSLWTLQTASDERNLARIEEVIEEHGYPGKSLVGSRYMGTAFLVIQHSNQEAQEKYLPVLKQAADDGEVR